MRRRVVWWGFWLPAGVAVLLTAAVIAIGLAQERNVSLRGNMVRPVEGVLVSMGLGLDQVSVSGLRFTPDADVFDALALDKARTIVGFDARAARRRIEALPWVETVSIARVFPGGLDVRVVERQPFALWRTGKKHIVIDRQGRPLAAVGADAMPGLRRVAGDGADLGAAGLFDKLGAYPDLLQRVQLAERQATGRWTLHLKPAFAVHLPLENEGEAIARAAVLVAAGLGDKGVIDLRDGARLPLRARSTAQGAPTPGLSGQSLPAKMPPSPAAPGRI